MCKIEKCRAYLSTLNKKTTLIQKNQPIIKHKPPKGVRGPMIRINEKFVFENKVSVYNEPLNKMVPIMNKLQIHLNDFCAAILFSK